MRLRGGLIKALTGAGHSVLGLAPDLDQTSIGWLDGLQAEAASYPLRPGGVQPLGERRSIDALAGVLSGWRADTVIGFGLKPMLLAALAARRSGAGLIVPLVSSLGELAHGAQARPGITLRMMMRSALSAAHAIVFHNGEDADRLTESGVMPDGAPVYVVPGRGVDLIGVAAEPVPPLSPGLMFTMIARLEPDKGVIEFCEAARRVRSSAGATRFILAGAEGIGRDRITPETLAGYAGCVEWVGEVADVRPLLAASHVFVLPSYAEGMPPAVQEALAIGRPVIACDVPGSRDTVDERVNGVLVAKQDVTALANAMQSFLNRPDLIASMARASRSKAERRFDINQVNAAWFAILGLDASGLAPERRSTDASGLAPERRSKDGS